MADPPVVIDGHPAAASGDSLPDES